MASGIVEQSSKESEQKQGQQGVRGGERARLVQRLLDASGDLPAFITDLLATQAVTVVGTEAAAFMIERAAAGEDGRPQVALRSIAHIRPDQSDQQTRQAALQAFEGLVRRCVLEGKDGAINVGGPVNQENEGQYCLITLLRDGTDVIAVSSVICRCRDQERAMQRLNSMQLVAGYLEFFSLRRQAENSRAVALDHQRVLQLSRAVADADGYLSAAMNLCNELANATGASRVSLGWLKGRNVRVVALSHTEEFDKKQELVVQLERAMEECFDQEQPVLYDPVGVAKAAAIAASSVEGSAVPATVGTDAVTRQAALLSRAQGGPAVLSLPLRRHADIEGVVTLEFVDTSRVNPKVLESLVLSVDLLAPQLYDRHENDRYLVTKTALSARWTAEELLGPRHWVAKLVTLGIVLLLLGLTNFFGLPTRVPWLHWADLSTTYHVTAPMTFSPIEGAQRSLSAPFDGILQHVYKVPGEPVKAGAPLFQMRTVELQEQMYKAQGEAAGHAAKARVYVNDQSKQAEMQAELSQQRASEAEARYYQSRIGLATVVAPFDGTVIKGDLNDKQGSSVKEGEELMTFGNIDALRAELSVNERDIQDIKSDGTGTLATTSKPTDKYTFKVNLVDPQGHPKEGANVFTVYVTPDKMSDSWRPGMAGEAKVNVGPRSWGWIWTHRLIDFVRLKTWM